METTQTSEQTPEQQAQPAQGSQQPSESEASRQALERTPMTSAALQRGSDRSDPFAVMRRFGEDMNRFFNDFFGSTVPRWGGWPEALAWGGMGEQTFWPNLEVHHRGNKLIIRADLPGLQRDDVVIEVWDHELSISGERHGESEGQQGRYYRAERSFGRFCRVVALPEGAKPDTASATFENGVLQIEMEAPGWGTSQGRRIEVREGSPH
jgi:HSP20 family protein